MARITDKPKVPPHIPGLASVPSRQPSKLPPTKQPAKAEKAKEYPWDSHQDDIVVNSTELNTAGRKLGIEHYRHQLTLRKTYEHITTDFAEDHRRMIPKDALPVPFSSSPLSSNDENDEEKKPDKHEDWDGKARLPKPKFNRLDYSESIYRARTANPAVFLAIIRIAEKNLPFINFDSAIMHLPNRAVNASLPSLPPPSPFSTISHSGKGKKKAVFTQDTPYQEKKDEQIMTVLFLPEFYKDGRHAVGYYDIAPDRDNSKRLEAENVVQVLFTPCETEDLARWGLVQWVYDAACLDEARRLDAAMSKADDEADEEHLRERGMGETEDRGEEPDAELMECVGVRGGKWLDFGVVEDYDEWAEGFRVVRRIWQKMIKDVVSGEEEGEAQV